MGNRLSDLSLGEGWVEFGFANTPQSFDNIYQYVEEYIARQLRMLEYMLESRQSSWRFPSSLQTILNLLQINL